MTEKTPEEINATTLRESEKMRAAALLKSEKTGATELRQSEEKAATLLKETHVQHAADLEGHKQALSWMSGGYSVDSGAADTDSGENKENTKTGHQKSAVELKSIQSAKALELRETQRKNAEDLKEAHKEKALELLDTQQKAADDSR